MKIFIAGICGTFMAGIAQIAQSLDHQVTGCDSNIYPPMSGVLKAAGIAVQSGYDPSHIANDIDVVVIGNALSRGNPIVEYVLNNKLCYQSGPAWLSEHVLRHRKVIAVAGTHGKTTTSSMLAWILECAGYHPGFLIGGKPGNFEESARLGDDPFFVIEADEYDTAFFDKRSKFVHYQPSIAILNNLEFDHADIFDDIGQIKKQFHHLVRIVPANGHIVINNDDQNISDVLDMGSWSVVSRFGSDEKSDWQTRSITPDAREFNVVHQNRIIGSVNWNYIGDHNMANALAAIAACHQADIDATTACSALSTFIPSARRLQLRYEDPQICLYEDFAHHPTAIAATLGALKNAHPKSRMIAIVEPRSNTMQLSYHQHTLGPSLGLADQIIFYLPREVSWNPFNLEGLKQVTVSHNPEEVVEAVSAGVQGSSVIVAMSNGSFDDIPTLLTNWLKTQGHRNLHS